MELVRLLEQLFETHAPETLMAFFGAMTSLLLFYLMSLVLRHFFGLQMSRANQEADQDLVTTALVESLVGALVTEGSHLRQTLDNLLQEALRYEQKNAQDLTVLLTKSEETPRKWLNFSDPSLTTSIRKSNRPRHALLPKSASCRTSLRT